MRFNGMKCTHIVCYWSGIEVTSLLNSLLVLRHATTFIHLNFSWERLLNRYSATHSFSL